MGRPDCVFCKIIDGELPAIFVLKEDDFVAFRDINPVAPTHILIVPREHIGSLAEAKSSHDRLLGRLLLGAHRVALDLGVAKGGYRTIINTGAGAGQSVFHLHVHLLAGKAFSWP